MIGPGKGRPSHLRIITQVLLRAKDRGEIKKNTSQGKLVKVIQETLGSRSHHEDTIRKFAKLWKLAWIEGHEIDNPRDLKWLKKNNLETAHFELSFELAEDD